MHAAVTTISTCFGAKKNLARHPRAGQGLQPDLWMWG